MMERTDGAISREDMTGEQLRAAYNLGPYVEFDKDDITEKLNVKQAALKDTQRILLKQLAELPGGICKTDDGRDLSKILHKVTTDSEFMNKWIGLVSQL